MMGCECQGWRRSKATLSSPLLVFHCQGSLVAQLPGSSTTSVFFQQQVFPVQCNCCTAPAGKGGMEILVADLCTEFSPSSCSFSSFDLSFKVFDIKRCNWPK